jgi:ubiquinone/menaquinone biosynthesis C-methylase UbiE
MKSKNSCLFIGLLTGAFLFLWGKLVYSRRSRQRIPSFEGLEDPHVSMAFDRMSHIPPMRLMRRFVVNRAASMSPRGQAVDLGCGSGLLVIELAREAPGLAVTGIDISSDVLVMAEYNAYRADLGDRITLKRGDAGHIPFPDASLDFVISTLSLHHWNDPVAVLDEIDRVLRPGGSFLVFDLRRDMLAPFYILIWFVTHFIAPSALRRIKEPLGSRNASYTPEEAMGLAQKSKLDGWRVNQGPFWLTIEGTKPDGENLSG